MDVRTNKDVFIEVYNIVLDRDLEDGEKIGRFLTHRLRQKI